jgi:hypothetical protein
MYVRKHEYRPCLVVRMLLGFLSFWSRRVFGYPTFASNRDDLLFLGEVSQKVADGNPNKGFA